MVLKKKKQRCDFSDGRSVLGGLEANAGSATGDDAGEMRERREGRKGRNVHGHDSLEEGVRGHPQQIAKPAAPSQPPHRHHPNPTQSRSLARSLPAGLSSSPFLVLPSTKKGANGRTTEQQARDEEEMRRRPGGSKL